MNTVSNPIDERLQVYRRAVEAFYEEVFNHTPECTFEDLPRGDHAIILEGWMWIFWAGEAERWTCRIVVPPDDPFFERHRCLRRLDGFEVEKPTFEDAIVFAIEKESHRKFHLALDTLKARKRNVRKT